MFRCRKCGMLLKQKTLKTQEPTCRGTQEANLICGQCGEEFPDFRLLRVREFDCARLAARRAAKAAAPTSPMYQWRRGRQVSVTGVECSVAGT